jgi:hypothetical protein
VERFSKNGNIGRPSDHAIARMSPAEILAASQSGASTKAVIHFWFGRKSKPSDHNLIFGLDAASKFYIF